MTAEPSPFGYVLMAFQKYAVFKGWSRRKGYWYFFLFNFVIQLGLDTLERWISHQDGATSTASTVTNDARHVYGWAVYIPYAAVSFRRLQDIGKNGWWSLALWGPTPIISLTLLFTKVPLSRLPLDVSRAAFLCRPRGRDRVPRDVQRRWYAGAERLRAESEGSDVIGGFNVMRDSFMCL